jgi:tripartite-type tricarboxylate transporter receptor subunit TctC
LRYYQYSFKQLAIQINFSMIGLMAMIFSQLAIAQSWPNRPINLVTPLATGSASDVALRIVAERLGTALGQTLLIDNQTGASGAIGAEKVMRATADGYTFCGCNNAILGVLPQLRKVSYDPKLFKPVGMIAVLPTVLVVHPSIPVNTIPEFIAFIKANPGKVNYASGGVGSAQHMAMFESFANVKLVHLPYKGASQAAVGTAGGEVAAMFNTIGTVLPFIKSGKLKPIGIAGAQRTNTLPEVPTIAESGVKGYNYAAWIGIVAPPNTPDEIVSKLSTELFKVVSS